MHRILPLLRFTSAAAVLSLLIACGSGDGAPHDSKVRFSPASVNQLTTAGVFGLYQIQHVNVTLLTGGDQPLSNTGFLLSTEFGVFVYEGQLTWDEAMLATPLAPPVNLKTGQFGSKVLTVLYPTDPAVGTFTLMEVWSGTAYEKWNVNYTCQDLNDADTEKCPGGA